MIRILIADDHPLVRTGLRQILARHEDMSVLGEAEDYSGILAQLREKEFDVMLLDVSLPGKNGIEILKALREIHPALKVLFITGFAAVALNARRTGRTAEAKVLSKPFHLRDLVAQIDRILAA